eukprot:361613-Chlamydomonas_euryale.AAC.6
MQQSRNTTNVGKNDMAQNKISFNGSAVMIPCVPHITASERTASRESKSCVGCESPPCRARKSDDISSISRYLRPRNYRLFIVDETIYRIVDETIAPTLTHIFNDDVPQDWVQCRKAGPCANA